MSASFTITPETKIKELLDRFPEIEEKLQSLSPAFARLKNPVLRNTLGRVATVGQVAATANLPLSELIGTLRAWTGVETESVDRADPGSSLQPRPEWLIPEHIVATLDARPILARGEHPLKQVMEALPKLNEGDIFQLTTPFLPAPLLEKVAQKGFAIYSEKSSDELYQNYFCKIQTK